MGDDEHGAPFRGQILDDADHLLLQFGIKGGRGFIKQKSFGFHGQSAGDGRPLLLSARQLGRVDIAFFADTHFVEKLASTGLYFGFVLLENSYRSFHYILQDGHMRPKVELLEDHRQVGTQPSDLRGICRTTVVVRRAPANGLTLENNRAFLADFQHIAAAQQGGFPRSRRANQRHHITTLCGDVDAFENFKIAIGFMEISYFNHRYILVTHENPHLSRADTRRGRARLAIQKRHLVKLRGRRQR